MSYGWTEHLKQHMAVYSDGNAGKHPYKCNLCDNSFGICDAIEQHMLIHTVKHPFKCNICDNLFSRFDALEQHMFMHTGEHPYQCTLCDKTFDMNAES